MGKWGHGMAIAYLPFCHPRLGRECGAKPFSPIQTIKHGYSVVASPYHREDNHEIDLYASGLFIFQMHGGKLSQRSITANLFGGITSLCLIRLDSHFPGAVKARNQSFTVLLRSP